MTKRLWDKGNALDTEVHRFTVGLDHVFDQRLAVFDAVASAAHARMLNRIGVLESKECSSLLSELQKIAEESRAGEFSISPDLEDCHTAIEMRLTETLGEAGKKIHTGRSRNDQVLVALRLFLREELLGHLELLEDLVSVLTEKAKQELVTPLPGYTHMQRAMPTTAATQILSYAEWSQALVHDGLSLLHSLNWNPLGVGSGFGVPLELDRDYTSKLLSFEQTQPNPIFVQSTRGREELKFLNWLTDISSLIEKSALDLLLFSTQEFGFVSIPVEFTTGSSIMPQKRNPDVLELLRAQASRVRAMRDELQGILAKLPSSYHRDLQYAKEPLFRCTDEVRRAVTIFTAVFPKLSFNRERALEMFEGELFATDEAFRLVALGEPFRDAYLHAAEKLKNGEIPVAELTEAFLAREKVRCEKELLELELRRTSIAKVIAGVRDAHASVCRDIFKEP
ncbi:MAG: argininosuccinate lyase [Bdellovibrionales bacterium]|nr:argininosuccinate lyase [Bdellovibrionales bacterium]